MSFSVYKRRQHRPGRSFKMAADSQEYFWGCELRKDKPETTWSFEEEEEEEDTEYLIHTLFLKHAVLGPSAVKGERNVVEIETKNFEKNIVKQSLLSLTLGQQDMFMLDISFSQGSPVTFRLIEGSGPVCLAGQQLVEYPDDINESQDESMLDDDLGEEEEEEISKDEESFKKIPTKRKASSQISGKKGKRDSSPDEEEDEDEEDDEDMESDEMDDEDEEDDDGKSDKKKTKGKKIKREGDAFQAGKKLKSAKDLNLESLHILLIANEPRRCVNIYRKASPKRAVKASVKSKKAVKK